MAATTNPRRRSSRRSHGIAAGALIVALALYLAGREGLWMHRALAAVGVPTGQLVGRLPRWLVDVVPDGLWQLAFCAVVASYTERVAIAALPLALGLGIELLSAFHLVEGVFDPLDLLAMTLGGAVGYALVWRQRRASSRLRALGTMVAFSLMLAATSKAPAPRSKSSGPVAAPLPVTPGPSATSSAATPFEVPPPLGMPQRLPKARLQLRRPAGTTVVEAETRSEAPAGPRLVLALPSGYEASIDTAERDLDEAKRNARAHEDRGAVEVLLAEPDAVVAGYAGGCRAMACRTVRDHRLCGSIGAPAQRPDGGGTRLPTLEDCAAFVAAVRALRPL